MSVLGIVAVPLNALTLIGRKIARVRPLRTLFADNVANARSKVHLLFRGMPQTDAPITYEWCAVNVLLPTKVIQNACPHAT